MRGRRWHLWGAWLLSGPQGLVKCCLKVLGFELPSCLVKGFFPLLSSISIFYKEHEKGSIYNICISKSSLLSLLHPARSLPQTRRATHPSSEEATLVRGPSFNSSSAKLGRDEKAGFFQKQKTQCRFSWGKLGAAYARAFAFHLFLKPRGRAFMD